MPMSTAFQGRLLPHLRKIADHFGTPFHIYDEVGIRGTGRDLVTAFQAAGVQFREYFAVKALPNPRILDIMQDMGFGFDCSSPSELALARSIGARGEDLFFTSTNTTREEFELAFAGGGALVNLDDLALLDKLPFAPQTLCFRYNPGSRRVGSPFMFIGDPEESKFGIAHHQLAEAYRRAQALGIERFGMHTMHTANALDYRVRAESSGMLLELAGQIGSELGLRFAFINLGGGFGIPYRPDERPLDVKALAQAVGEQIKAFETEHAYRPQVFMESGRMISGPHGVLVTAVTNVKETYRIYAGVDACMSALMRPGMYGAYHHISVLGKTGAPDDHPVDVVGSLCENNDKFAVQRQLPALEEGDLMIIHDTGAHAHSMGFNYNGRLRPKELLLRVDGSVELIRREETLDDYLATLKFAPDSLLL